jgi:flagellar hook-basal body complex protein FliE
MFGNTNKSCIIVSTNTENKFKNTEKMDKLDHTIPAIISSSIRRNIQENVTDAIITIKKANVTDEFKKNAINKVIEAQKDIEKANARILKALDNIQYCQKTK